MRPLAYLVAFVFGIIACKGVQLIYTKRFNLITYVPILFRLQSRIFKPHFELYIRNFFWISS